MKKVFNSNTQLAQTFAAQSQTHGKTSSMFFERDTAYSYGYHYIAAKFITADNGEIVCFINKNPYSNTTSRHCQELWNSIPSGIKNFRFSFGSRLDREILPKLIENEKKELKILLGKQLSARNNWHYFLQAELILWKIQDVSKLFNLSEIKCEHFKDYGKALAKYLELKDLKK
jgi:hypothetical protein